MPLLTDYRQFDGLHWETGSVRNFYDYRGVKAPHTGQPFSEALLMGISGGIVMAYFTFAYEGNDPQARILTRNTFDPMSTLLERLGAVQTNLQTTNPNKAVKNLIETLDSGYPAIVWADAFSLPYQHGYNDLDASSMWMMMPLVVYGYEGDTAHLADRARVPLIVPAAALDAARGRVKKDKYRLLTLDAPNPDKIVSAVQKGIWDCIKLFTEAPPKGSRDNFGFAAYKRLAEVLTKPTARMSWDKEFPAGRKLYAGLVWLYNDIAIFGKDSPAAERDTYADFLDEASVLLNKPALKEAAAHFRASADQWCDFAARLLPEDVAPFKETRDLLVKQHRLFLDEGMASVEERHQISARLAEIRKGMEDSFPLDAAGVMVLRGDLPAQVMALHDTERGAISLLQEAMG